MPNLKLAPSVEIAALKRKIAKLESDLAYLQQFRYEDLMRVYRAAMRWDRQWWPEVCDCAPSKSEIALHNACARAAKMSNTGRGGRGK